MEFYKEQQREVPVVREYDVIVCGAGPAGVSAAIASARRGVKTCLIEVNGCLGGTWTSGLMTWIIDHDNKNGFIKELVNDLKELTGNSCAPMSASAAFDVEDMKYILEKKCIEAGVDIRLHTRVVSAVKNKYSELEYIITESKSGREAWGAKLFIDATGDGDLAFHADCEFEFGNPENGSTQPMSLLCLLSGIKLDEVKELCDGYSNNWSESKILLRKEMNECGIEPTYSMPTLFHLVDDIFMMMANHQYELLATNADDVTAATLAGRKEINEQIRALKSKGGRWRDLRLVATAEQIGTREGRRIKGLYQLTLEDMLKGAEFPDAICKCSFGVDVHSTASNNSKGIESSGKYKTKPYDIPLRALISSNVSNLMMAGRCICGDFLAHSSYRVTGTAVPVGEAAGIAAALAVLEGVKPAEVNSALLGII